VNIWGKWGKNTAMSFNALRYLRHIDLPQLGVGGQEKISLGSALLVGMGGLGAPAALYLAAGGVGHLGLCDHDVVEEGNLQRQVIFRESDLGKLKTECAENHLRALNGQTRLTRHDGRLDESNAAEILKNYDVILDCSDNFATRYLLNQVCIQLKKPLISASVQGFAGQIGVFRGHLAEHACYRCLFPQTPPRGMVPNCPEAGVFGPIVGIMGTLQAGEAMKELAGLGEKDKTPFLMLDALGWNIRKIAVARNPDCPDCSGGSKLAP
jgi:molybdopterin/thiamine biosynthesis adenylyltransferase